MILFEFCASLHIKDSGMLFLLSLLQRSCRHLSLYQSLRPIPLEIGTAPPKYTFISLPTVYFSTANLSGSQCDDDKPYAAWQKVLRRAIRQASCLDAPVGCGAACNYTIQYIAPGLQCTELSMDEVNRLVPSTVPYTVVYNAKYTGMNMSMAWHMYGTNGQSTATGALCSLSNTTQQSVVSFVTTTEHFPQYCIPRPCKVRLCVGFEYRCVTLQDSDVSSHNYAYIVTWLYDQLNGTLLRIPLNDSVPAFTWIPATNFNLISNNLFSLNETAGTFTPNSNNVIGALEQILVNATVALITSLAIKLWLRHRWCRISWYGFTISKDYGSSTLLRWQ